MKIKSDLITWIQALRGIKQKISNKCQNGSNNEEEKRMNEWIEKKSLKWKREKNCKSASIWNCGAWFLDTTVFFSKNE